MIVSLRIAQLVDGVGIRGILQEVLLNEGGKVGILHASQQGGVSWLDGVAAQIVHGADLVNDSLMCQLRLVDLSAVQLLARRCIVDGVVIAGVALLHMNEADLIDQVKSFMGSELHIIRGQDDAAFPADILQVAVDVIDEVGGGLIDGFQGCAKLRQLAALAPVGDIPKGVISSLNTIILTDGMIGYPMGYAQSVTVSSVLSAGTTSHSRT